MAPPPASERLASEFIAAGNENVLQMRFGQADVACPSQVKATHALGQRPFDASALGILLGEGLGFFSCSGRLQGFVLGFGAHCDGASGWTRAGALELDGTSPAVAARPRHTSHVELAQSASVPMKPLIIRCQHIV